MISRNISFHRPLLSGGGTEEDGSWVGLSNLLSLVFFFAESLDIDRHERFKITPLVLSTKSFYMNFTVKHWGVKTSDVRTDERITNHNAESMIKREFCTPILEKRCTNHNAHFA